MGGCISDPSINKIGSRKPQKMTYNPIQNIIDKYSIETLKQKWDREELKQIENKVAAEFKKSITFQDFQTIFPKISNFSKKTQQSYYNLFAFQGNPQVSKQQIIISLTIIRKVNENKYFAPLIFYIYTGDKKHEVMSEEQFSLFQQENKSYAKNFQSIELEEHSQIEEISESPDEGASPKVNGSRVSSKSVDLQKFTQFFENYNLKSYQIIFSWNLAEQELEVIKQISKNGLAKKKGDKIYLVEYQWFLTWKQYVEFTYNKKIELKEEREESNYVSHRSIRRQSKDGPKFNESIKIEKPGQIKNYLLKYGKRDNQLLENLIQYNNYICVGEQIWNKLIAIYNGGPAIYRVYPQIYYNSVIKVSISSSGKFIPKSSKKLENRQKSPVSSCANANEVKQKCYFKYPGKTNWNILKDIETKCQQIFNCPRTYLTFVPQSCESSFLQRYNIQELNNQKIQEQRLKNYGAQINVSLGGVLTRAQVVEIEEDDDITIEYIAENSNNHKMTIRIDQKLRNLNPVNLSSEARLNHFAGLTNIGNTCYMNAVIQCIIRTPYFGSYLEGQNFKTQPEQLVLEQLLNIYMESKSDNHESINTKSFKRIFEKHCPFFQGNSQHDAQQFLICMLERIMEEIKLKKQEYGLKSQIRDTNGSKQVNQAKVVKFFSGKTRAITKCKKCKKEGERIEPFFTYSVSLPHISQMQFYYLLVRSSKSSSSMIPIRCGITLNRKATIEQFIEAISKANGISQKNIALYTVFNNQILNRLQYSSYYKQVSFLLHFNAKLICYQVQHEHYPTYKDFKNKQLAQKSIKIQLRQRIYSVKNKEYKILYTPFILEIKEKIFWKDVVAEIENIISKLDQKSLIIDSSNNTKNQNSHIGNQSKFEQSEKKMQFSMIRRAQTVEKPSVDSIKIDRQSLTDKKEEIKLSDSKNKAPYNIRVIKSDHYYQNYCVFCKQQFFVTKKYSSNKICTGCTFNKEVQLFEQSQFRNISDNIIIVVDWEQFIPQFQIHTTDSTYNQCIEKADQRKDLLEELLVNNFNNEEELELTCESEECQYKYALRSEKISIFPNILLLHLKRFTYEDNRLVKLLNNVYYPQQLDISNKKQRYELYGVVSHIGSGVGGHYISFVKVGNKWYKCDDSKVTLLESSTRLMDSNAYLLFYRKIDFQASLMTLSF